MSNLMSKLSPKSCQNWRFKKWVPKSESKIGGPKIGPKMGFRTDIHRISKDICPCLQGEHTFGIWTHPNRPQI